MSTFGLVVSLNNSKLPLSVLVRVRQAPKERGCPLTTSIYSFPSTAPATRRIAYRLLNSPAPTLQEAAKTPETHNQTKLTGTPNNVNSTCVLITLHANAPLPTLPPCTCTRYIQNKKACIQNITTQGQKLKVTRALVDPHPEAVEKTPQLTVCSVQSGEIIYFTNALY